jgi:hypothetical protein
MRYIIALVVLLGLSQLDFSEPLLVLALWLEPESPVVAAENRPAPAVCRLSEGSTLLAKENNADGAY